MGCDIHCYMEYSRDGNSWRSFGGRTNPGRNYLMFSLMAGVRNYNEPKYLLFKPKGLPKNIGYSADDDNYLFITDSNEEGCATAESAAKWVKRGTSHYKQTTLDKNHWVSHPDWHSHSWLTYDELNRVLNRYQEIVSKEGLEHHEEPAYKVILACLNEFEKLGYESRLVFWFDN